MIGLAGKLTSHLRVISRTHRTANERPASNKIYCHILYSFLYLYVFTDVSVLQKSKVTVKLGATLSRIQKDSSQFRVCRSVHHHTFKWINQPDAAISQVYFLSFNPLNPELNPICYLLALLGAHHFLHVSRIRVKSLTFRLLMSYIYIYEAPILDVSRSHTTTQHSR